jgi:hypothetical protein
MTFKVNTKMANKAVNKGYTEDPFYKLDKRYSGTRYIAWAGDKEQQAQLFWLPTDIIGPRIEYLFKIEIDISSDGIIWQRIYGGILYDDLKCIIESDEGLFFSRLRVSDMSPHTR